MWKLSDAFAQTPRRSRGAMLDRRYCNARADDCSLPRTGAGPMTVHYQGADYAVIGVYFKARNGRDEICYVLRPTPLSDEDIAPARSRGAREPRPPNAQ